MSTASPVRRLLKSVLIGVVSCLLGLVVLSSRIADDFLLTRQAVTNSTGRLTPAPHVVPKIKGSVPLRLAMVHDVLHERYAKHSAKWYEAQAEHARRSISKVSETTGDPAERFDAMDTLAVSLDRLHRPAEAATVMREKLSALPPLTLKPASPPAMESAGWGWEEFYREDLARVEAAAGLAGTDRHHYTAHANLGTALIHGNMMAALAGDRAARDAVADGLAHVDESVRINPAAHAGRENWQALAVRHLLAGIEDPQLLTEFDLAGDRLTDPPPPDAALVILHGKGSMQNTYRLKKLRAAADPFAYATGVDPAERWQIRMLIPTAGVHPEWARRVGAAYPGPMPFDEPVLGLLGMWTLGGGPNPLSALTLGKIMEQVGQRDLAWAAYERAVGLFTGWGPTTGDVPAARATLVDWCRARQRAIAADKAPADPAKWEAEARAAHRAELAAGEAYQKAYQQFEEDRLAAGASVADPDFHKPFLGAHEIATPVGTEDMVRVWDPAAARESWVQRLPVLVLFGGLGMVAGLFVRPRQKREAWNA